MHHRGLLCTINASCTLGLTGNFCSHEQSVEEKVSTYAKVVHRKHICGVVHKSFPCTCVWICVSLSLSAPMAELFELGVPNLVWRVNGYLSSIRTQFMVSNLCKITFIERCINAGTFFIDGWTLDNPPFP